MKKIVAALATIMLLGAGCTGGSSGSAQSGYATEQKEVQAVYDAFLAVGLGDNPDGVAAYLASGSLEDFEGAGVGGYFENVSTDLDWSKAEWSNGGKTVKLFTRTEGIDAGVWTKDASGNWKLTNKFWFGE